jgi:hypothetical protein
MPAVRPLLSVDRSASSDLPVHWAVTVLSAVRQMLVSDAAVTTSDSLVMALVPLPVVSLVGFVQGLLCGLPVGSFAGVALASVGAIVAGGRTGVLDTAGG